MNISVSFIRAGQTGMMNFVGDHRENEETIWPISTSVDLAKNEKERDKQCVFVLEIRMTSCKPQFTKIQLLFLNLPCIGSPIRIRHHHLHLHMYVSSCLYTYL